MLQQKIRDEMKAAMIAKDQVRLDVVRGIISAFTNELVAKKRKPSEELTDEEAQTVISRIAKQRKESIDQFKKANREDLVKEEEDQFKYIEVYLPKMMERAEVEKAVRAKQKELGITDATKKGMLMSAAMKDLKGKADGALVKEIVDSLF
ncbi:MAG TPA: GatB/YqeY domain-containing protein [Candidatus Paceibacterota bacterium]